MSESEVSSVAKRRKELRETYGSLYEKAEALLFKHDPAGLDFGENLDEYDPEVDAILPQLHLCRSSSEVTAIIHREFVRLFDEHMAGPLEAYNVIGADLWILWQEFKASSSGNA
ncbi:hypothetical protein CH92_17565 [Stutzerimonas stutzeri]|uniref:Uncharacterized protein n=1 Tax=Stutzerimonas stutzeri TaxID=316 RepID=W8R2H1_STUST|nr:hypothetical protein [Stutzerimonas stutzeri]AHL76804.1 hypothetical protein CH92_17565 [Stutzerimonas stutzeri]MCQ4331706.1 hypothetical protein [Stutzerimonas stutzeri]